MIPLEPEDFSEQLLLDQELFDLADYPDQTCEDELILPEESLVMDNLFDLF